MSGKESITKDRKIIVKDIETGDYSMLTILQYGIGSCQKIATLIFVVFLC